MQSYDNLRTALAPQQRGRGWYQDEVSRQPLYNGLSMDEKAAVNAFINPGHGTNCIDAQPLPDGTPGRVYLFKSQWTRAISAGDVDIQFLSLPFFEAPFAVRYHGGQPAVIQSPLARLPGQDNSSGYLDGMGVYSYRMLGQSMTIDNSTVVVGLSGESLSVHKTSDVDFAMLNLGDAIATTADANRRVLQGLPWTMAQLSAMTGSTSTTPAKDGAYVVSHHENMSFQKRDFSYKKTVGYYAGANTNAASGLYYTTTASPASQFTCNLMADDGALSASKTQVSFPANGDVCITNFEGLTLPSRFVVKFTMIYELQLKANSPLWQYAVSRPPCNMALMDALHAYEQYRCKLPGSGVMPADANFWNEIWDGFKKYALPVIGNVASTLVPGLSAPIKALTSMVSPTAEPEKVVQRAVAQAHSVTKPLLRAVKTTKPKKTVHKISRKK